MIDKPAILTGSFLLPSVRHFPLAVWLAVGGSLVRIGTLVMLVHDVSDVFMESAKLFNYAQKRFHWCHVSEAK